MPLLNASTNLYVGSTPVVAVYQGTTKVWPSKYSVRPGDVFTVADPLIPAWANTSALIARFLSYAGFAPNYNNRLPWVKPAASAFTYMGFSFYWTGDHWANGTGITFITGISPTATAAFKAVNGGSTAFQRMAAADRVPALNARYEAATPATPWTGDQNMWFGQYICTWNGSSWVIVAECPQPGTSKQLLAGVDYVDASITTSDATNAAKLTGLGYVPYATYSWQSPTVANTAGVFNSNFQNLALNQTDAFYWNGSSWVAGTPAIAGVAVAPGAVQADATIAALPAIQRVVAMTLAGYVGSPATHWTTGQSATIGGVVVHWHVAGSTFGWWVAGARP